MATIAEINARARELLIPSIESAGYEVVELNFLKKKYENYLEIVIYKKEGISLDDCMIVNNLLSPILDEHDITDGVNYNLNISSPGLDRLIISEDDFRRNLGVELEAILKKSAKKTCKVVGFLESYDNESIVLIVKNKKNTILRNDIEILRPYINMNKLK